MNKITQAAADLCNAAAKAGLRFHHGDVLVPREQYSKLLLLLAESDLVELAGTGDTEDVHDDGECEYCREHQPGEPARSFRSRDQHVACALRDALGGIGHLIDCQKWCKEHNDPDAGLSPRESALLVAEWVQRYGAPAAAAIPDHKPEAP